MEDVSCGGLGDVPFGEAPVVAGIKTWLTAQAVPPRSSLGEAIGYTLRHWEGLERFLGRT